MSIMFIIINIALKTRRGLQLHENSVGLSSTTNPKPKGQPSISLPAQANLTQQKAEPLRCLALRTRGGRLKSSFVLWELSLPT